MRSRTAVAILALLGCGAPPRAEAAEDPLRAGAGAVDITPPASALGATDVVRDPLFARAIVVEGGGTCAVLVGLDQIGFPQALAAETIAKAASATGCPTDQIVISATHTHSSTAGSARGPQVAMPELQRAILAAIEQSRATLRPARIGFAKTDVHLNVNRDLFADGRWTQGANPAGPSDKALAVVALVDEAGRPIAAYLNYAMHPINFYMSGVISADFAGEAARYVEQRYGGAMVAIFAQGASGDQNPLLNRPQNRLSRIRTGVAGSAELRVGPQASDDRETMGRRMQALGQPVPATALQDYRSAADEVGALVAAEGTLLGESAVDLIQNQMTAMAPAAIIRGTSATVTCPGRDRQDGANPIREGGLPPYADGAPVTLRVGMLRLGDIYLSTVNAEVYTEIGLRLKREAQVPNLMLTTLANGSANSGYVYSDAARDNLTFQVIGSRLKPGCAESGIVNASLLMIDAVR